MTIEETGPDHPSDHILDWLEDSVPFFSSFLDETSNSSSINCYQWWDENQDTGEDLINGCLSNSPTTVVSTRQPNTPTSHHLPPSDLTKKRKAPDDSVHKKSQTHQNPRKNQNNQSKNIADKGSGAVEGVTVIKKSVGNKKNASKSTGNNYNNGSNKEGRWAEQLLNPCANAIVKGDATRVHHLLCVLQELASPTGDANHRLADHGLRALAYHLSSNSSSSSFSSYSSTVSPITFASTDPRFFQRSLIKFHEVSPWFAFPNNIANSSILHILSEESNRPRNLHILDIGVSHGVQWPTLLEALTRRSGGPPPLIRLTVIPPTVEHDQNTETPFSIGPPGDNISSRLLSFAKSLNINLQINRLDIHSLQSLNSQAINKSRDEILIVCSQFRLHQLKHSAPDERQEFLQNLRKMEPKAVILSENNMGCSCSKCVNFEMGFRRGVEYVWKFLDSTSAAFKGRESEERRVMEGEAAKALRNVEGEMNEEKGKWCERMRNVGFERKRFGEDTIDTARASMRRYDNNWEMRMEDKDGCVGLWWKGQPVSFCSLWKLGIKSNAL
ncbi:nodulation-signaling pathway 1 protein [Cucumis melo var. makuwa]|uniref:Nodulation-signaling pathway 1 protein n=1 Tax=Cucumis melo var. makuwa TaxID=1194695 RepID=A0A5A7V101_CUCMM|nr:nodulation-signaling pathway 1 protein [Cucumis melo var. makuwa]TYK03926.1 nodulation-signaling pathway 1 protein [Cucumis melo var. makuwa]